VDETAMLGALEREGTAIAYVANNLLTAASSQKYRQYIAKGDLLLLSANHPESSFNVGNAMGRNKYIYCQSEAAIVIQSEKKGGTWNGALENLRQKWVPLWVFPNNDAKYGNSTLVDKGGHWLAQNISDEFRVASLVKAKNGTFTGKQQSIFDEPAFVREPREKFSNRDATEEKNRSEST